MSTSMPLDSSISPRQRTLLLGGWRDIADDLRRLAQALDRTPDSCACGDGHAHLGGRCPCCHAAQRTAGIKCDDCGTLLRQLRPKVDILLDDTIRYLPALMSFRAHRRRPIHDDLETARVNIAAVVKSFDRLQTAADEFQNGCSATHLHVVKESATSLRTITGNLERTLFP